MMKKYLDIHMMIGFTMDEAHRMKDSPIKWIINEFPLIYNMKYVRDDCKKELDKRGIHYHKSGCFDCPYLTAKRFSEYAKTHPEDLELVVTMEKGAKKFHEQNRKNNKKLAASKEDIHLFNAPIEKIIQENKYKTISLDILSGSKKEVSWDEDDSCDSGYCFI